jgi:hypothetical protein
MYVRILYRIQHKYTHPGTGWPRNCPFGQIWSTSYNFVFARYFESSGPISVQLKDFDPLLDFEIPGGDDVRFARPQLFFSCSLCPTGRLQDTSSHKEVSLVFFNTFEPISLTPDSYMHRNSITMVYKRADSQLPALCLVK